MLAFVSSDVAHVGAVMQLRGMAPTRTALRLSQLLIRVKMIDLTQRKLWLWGQESNLQLAG